MENPQSSPKAGWFPTFKRLVPWLFSWRTWRRALVTLAIFATAIVLFYAEENWRGKRAWMRYQRDAEAQGIRFDRQSLIPPPVPDDQNFASTPLLAAMLDFEPGTQKQRDTNAVERANAIVNKIGIRQVNLEAFAHSNTWVLATNDVPALYRNFLQTNYQEANHGRTLDLTGVTTPELATRVLAALAPADGQLNELRAAAKHPLSRFNVRYENDDPAAILLPHLGALRGFGRVLQMRASAELTLGRTDDAFNDIELMFRFIEAVRREPILISQLVRIADLQVLLQPVAQGLAAHQWSDAQLQIFQRQFGEIDFLADITTAMDGERIFFGGGIFEYVRSLSSMQRLHYVDQITAYPENAHRSFWLVFYAWAAPTGWYYFEQLNYARVCHDQLLPAIDPRQHRVMVAICKKAMAEDARRRNVSPFTALMRHEAFLDMTTSPLARIVQRAGCGQTAADLAGLACALERYRLANGSFPPALDSLAPLFVKTVPRDVVTGEPLKYRLNADGSFVLYSVGWNETDDGGTVVMSKDNPPHPDTTQGDWVWTQ